MQRLVLGTALFSVVVFTAFVSPMPIFHPLVLGLIALFGLGCLSELFSLLEAKKLRPAKKNIYLFFLLLLLTIYYAQFFGSYLPAALTLLLFSMSLFIHSFTDQNNPILNLSSSHFAFFFIAIPISLLSAIIYSPLWEEQGPLWLLFLVITTKCTDIGGYIFGKLLGKNKLAPKLSPNKTWEGALGGMFLCVAAGLIFQQLASSTPAFLLTAKQALALSFILSLFAQIGDLSESLLKRDAAKKDSSSLPGLGGLLDTADSLVFTTPLMYIFLIHQYSV